jgi:hypothetical protein
LISSRRDQLVKTKYRGVRTIFTEFIVFIYTVLSSLFFFFKVYLSFSASSLSCLTLQIFLCRERPNQTHRQDQTKQETRSKTKNSSKTLLKTVPSLSPFEWNPNKSSVSAAAPFSKMLSNGRGHGGKHVYDGVFGGGGGGAVKPGSRVEDYREIFGGFGATGSSIPILDVPELNENGNVSSVGAQRIDYAKIFGGFGDADFGLPLEEFLAKPKKVKSSINGTRYVWTLNFSFIIYFSFKISIFSFEGKEGKGVF